MSSPRRTEHASLPLAGDEPTSSRDGGQQQQPPAIPPSTAASNVLADDSPPPGQIEDLPRFSSLPPIEMVPSYSSHGTLINDWSGNTNGNGDDNGARDRANESQGEPQPPPDHRVRLVPPPFHRSLSAPACNHPEFDGEDEKNLAHAADVSYLEEADRSGGEDSERANTIIRHSRTKSTPNPAMLDGEHIVADPRQREDHDTRARGHSRYASGTSSGRNRYNSSHNHHHHHHQCPNCGTHFHSKHHHGHHHHHHHGREGTGGGSANKSEERTPHPLDDETSSVVFNLPAVDEEDVRVAKFFDKYGYRVREYSNENVPKAQRHHHHHHHHHRHGHRSHSEGEDAEKDDVTNEKRRSDDIDEERVWEYPDEEDEKNERRSQSLGFPRTPTNVSQKSRRSRRSARAEAFESPMEEGKEGLGSPRPPYVRSSRSSSISSSSSGSSWDTLEREERHDADPAINTASLTPYERRLALLYRASLRKTSNWTPVLFMMSSIGKLILGYGLSLTIKGWYMWHPPPAPPPGSSESWVTFGPLGADRNPFQFPGNVTLATDGSGPGLTHDEVIGRQTFIAGLVLSVFGLFGVVGAALGFGGQVGRASKSWGIITKILSIGGAGFIALGYAVNQWEVSTHKSVKDIRLSFLPLFFGATCLSVSLPNFVAYTELARGRVGFIHFPHRPYIAIALLATANGAFFAGWISGEHAEWPSGFNASVLTVTMAFSLAGVSLFWSAWLRGMARACEKRLEREEEELMRERQERLSRMGSNCSERSGVESHSARLDSAGDAEAGGPNDLGPVDLRIKDLEEGTVDGKKQQSERERSSLGRSSDEDKTVEGDGGEMGERKA